MGNENVNSERKQHKKGNSLSSYRWIENGHIFLWLIKDSCWSMHWMPGAMFMIAPTIGVAVYILWRGRHSRVDVFHNIAVCMWITANSIWMTGDFFKIELRPVSAALFIAGLATLIIYYIFFFSEDREKEL